MGQCTKPGGFKECTRDACIGCPNHVVVKDFDKFWDDLNDIEFEKTRKQLLKLKETLDEHNCDNSCDKIIPLMDCQHTTILMCECGYICEKCNKQMKFVDGKFVEM
jgi:predicted SprT family Zn-dependent metalloprotease